MDRGSLELLLARGLSYEEIGRRFDRHPSTVSYWAQKHGLVSSHRQKHMPKGGVDRVRLEALLDQGASLSRVAEALEVSESTVQYWLKKWRLRTLHAKRRQLASEAKRDGQATVQLTCGLHGPTVFFIEGRGSYRCLRCRREAVVRRRRKVKATLVAEAGGKCGICAYSRSVEALHFHHLDPLTKSFAIGSRGLSRSMEKLREEASKCVLLCANCHAEVEAGIVNVPVASGSPKAGVS